MGDTKVKSQREKIIELQQLMAESQVDLAKRAVEFIAGAETAAFVDGLKALLADTIPGGQLDQSLSQLINVTAQTGQIMVQLHQALAQQAAQAAAQQA